MAAGDEAAQQAYAAQGLGGGVPTLGGGVPTIMKIAPQYYGVGMSTAAFEADAESAVMPRCHLHTKPVLTCKFCRKYKSAVHHQARLAQHQASICPAEEKRNMLPMTNTTTFNVNPLLRENIMASEYFKSLYALKGFPDIIDELYQYADHAEPYCAGNSRAPSTFYCCLYKLLTMKLTDKQMRQLLDHVDSPYIRAVGFLYLRYVLPPEKLWNYYDLFFLDDEEFAPGTDKNRTTTMGEYVESLITEDKYFSTVLPRLPVRIKSAYGSQLVTLADHRRRKRQNKEQIEHFEPGQKVVACTKGDWLEGWVAEVQEPHPGRMSCLVKLEDDTEEVIDLGLVILRLKRPAHLRKGSAAAAAGGRRDSPRWRGGRKRSRSGSVERTDADSERSKAPKTQADLMSEFRRREREKALASGKDYARRPTSYKSALSLRLEGGAARRRSRSTSPSRQPDEPPPSLDPQPSFTQKVRMAQLMERYSKTGAGSNAHRAKKEVEGYEVTRLG